MKDVASENGRQTNGRTDRQMDGWTDKQMSKQGSGGWEDGGIERQMEGGDGRAGNTNNTNNTTNNH